jgi:hypothetical protein
MRELDDCERAVAALVPLAISLLILSGVMPPAQAAAPPLATSPPFDAHPINLANDAGHAFAPTVQASAGSVYVAWADMTPNMPPGVTSQGDRCPFMSTAKDPGVYDLLVAVSHDGGSTYSKPVDLSNRGLTTSFGLAVPVPLGGLYCVYSPQVSQTSPQIRIAVSGSNVYVVWGEREFVQGDDLGIGHDTGVFFTHSSNGGATFSSVINLDSPGQGTSESGNALAPEIAASGNNVYVVWEDHSTGKDTLFQRSTDGGQTFNGGTAASPVGAPINLSKNGNSGVPKVGAAGSTVTVVWQDDVISTGDIGLRRSNDGGATFLPELNVSHDGKASDPQLAVGSNGAAFVAWQDGSKSGTVSLGDISVGGSPDGTSAGAVVDMTGFHGPSQPAIGAAFDPQIAVTLPPGSAGALIYVAWLDTSPGFTALYAGVVAGSTSYLKITDSSVVPSNPRITAVGSSFFLAWTDTNQIEFAAGSAPSGGIPCCNGVIISDTGPTNDGREQVSIATGGDNVYVAWHDHTLPNGQVDVREYTALPQPPAITSPANGAVVITQTPTISGTSDPPLTIQVFDGSTMVGSTTPDPITGTWSVTTSKLSAGAHTMTAVAVNSAGTSKPSAGVAITVSVATTTTTSTPVSTTATQTGTSQGGGISEFPFQLLGTVVLTALIAVSYVLLVRGRSSRR